METRNNTILIADSSGLVSLVTATDHNHKRAVAATLAHREPDERLIILPTDVLAETVNVIGKRAGHTAALRAARELLDPDSPFILIDTSLHVQAALAKFATSPEAVSLTDCIVMAIADHYDTKDIFGFDKQFADAGYHRLEPSPDWPEAA